MFVLTQLAGFGVGDGAPAAVVLTFASGDVVDATGTDDTFTAANLGADPGNGLVAVAVNTFQFTGTITGVTVDGQAATELVGIFFDNTDTGIWLAQNVTNASGDIVVSYSGTNTGGVGYSAYRKAGGGTTAADTGTASGDADLGINAMVTVPANGAVLAAVGYRNRDGTAVWTGGVTEDFDDAGATELGGLTSANAEFVAGQSVTPAATITTGGGSAIGGLVVVAFGP